LKTLGAVSEPVGIMIYPNDFDSKELIKEHLDEWNDGLETEEQIIYSDMAETITDMMGTMLNLIQTVLVAFAAISLVVSAIMIGIITYVSVLERTKEIGILRSLGARKRDIKRVFNAETIIVGFVAGALGIGLTYLMSFPINSILSGMLDIDNIVQMDIVQSIGLIVLSVGLTVLSGLIPASIASKKDPVDALRTE
jgi:putative ABC transport system permease protein